MGPGVSSGVSGEEGKTIPKMLGFVNQQRPQRPQGRKGDKAAHEGHYIQLPRVEDAASDAEAQKPINDRKAGIVKVRGLDTRPICP